MENAKLLKKYQKQKEDYDKDAKELGDIESKEKLEKFLKTEGKLVSAFSSKETPSTSKKSGQTTGNSWFETQKPSINLFWF